MDCFWIVLLFRFLIIEYDANYFSDQLQAEIGFSTVPFIWMIIGFCFALDVNVTVLSWTPILPVELNVTLTADA